MIFLDFHKKAYLGFFEIFSVQESFFKRNNLKTFLLSDILVYSNCCLLRFYVMFYDFIHIYSDSIRIEVPPGGQERALLFTCYLYYYYYYYYIMYYIFIYHIRAGLFLGACNIVYSKAETVALKGQLF